MFDKPEGSGGSPGGGCTPRSAGNNRSLNPAGRSRSVGLGPPDRMEYLGVLPSAGVLYARLAGLRGDARLPLALARPASQEMGEVVPLEAKLLEVLQAQERVGVSPVADGRPSNALDRSSAPEHWRASSAVDRRDWV